MLSHPHVWSWLIDRIDPKFDLFKTIPPYIIIIFRWILSKGERNKDDDASIY